MMMRRRRRRRRRQLQHQTANKYPMCILGWMQVIIPNKDQNQRFLPKPKMMQNQKLHMVVILPKKHQTKLKIATRDFDINANDQTKQGPEPEIGTENQHEPESEVTKGGDTSTNKLGDSIGTEVISPGDGLQSNPPLSGKALLYQQYLESKQNNTTMNMPGDND